MYWQRWQRAKDSNTDRHWFLLMFTQLSTLSTWNQNQPPQSLASAALKCAVCNFCPSWWQTGSDTSGINSYFLTCCWVAYMLPVEISTFFSTNIHHCKALWNYEVGESCQWSHAVNKVERRVTGIHRKGKDSVCISAFRELWTTVQCSSCRTLPSQGMGLNMENSLVVLPLFWTFPFLTEITEEIIT